MDSSALYNVMAYNSGIRVAASVGGLALFVLHSFLLSRLFEKAHVPGWKAWIPVYNFYTFLILGGQPGWLILVSIIPVAGPFIVVIYLCVAAGRIGARLGKRGGWVVLFLFLELIWLGLLAFDSSTWDSAQVR